MAPRAPGWGALFLAPRAPRPAPLTALASGDGLVRPRGVGPRARVELVSMMDRSRDASKRRPRFSGSRRRATLYLLRKADGTQALRRPTNERRSGRLALAPTRGPKEK